MKLEPNCNVRNSSTDLYGIQSQITLHQLLINLHCFPLACPLDKRKSVPWILS